MNQRTTRPELDDKMMHLLLLLFVVFSSSLPHARSFPAPGWMSSPRTVDLSFRTTSTRLRSTDDKQSEIAALEERLRQLKDQEFSEMNTTPVGNNNLPMDFTDDEEYGMEGETEDSIMFSERWKEAKDGYVTKQQQMLQSQSLTEQQRQVVLQQVHEQQTRPDNTIMSTQDWEFSQSQPPQGHSMFPQTQTQEYTKMGTAQSYTGNQILPNPVYHPSISPTPKPPTYAEGASNYPTPAYHPSDQ